MAEAVYVLCAITSMICAAMLTRSYRKNRTRLLLWSSLCFLGLALNNIVLFVDLVMAPTVDLSLWRACIALVALCLLVFGLIWEAL